MDVGNGRAGRQPNKRLSNEDLGLDYESTISLAQSPGIKSVSPREMRELKAEVRNSAKQVDDKAAAAVLERIVSKHAPRRTNNETHDTDREVVTAAVNAFNSFRASPTHTVGWRCYEFLLFYLASRGRLDHIDDLLILAAKDSIKITEHMLGARLTCLYNTKRYEVLEKEVDEMRANGVVPLRVYATALQGYARTGNEAKSWEIFSEMCGLFPQRTLLYGRHPLVFDFLRSLQGYRSLLHYVELLLENGLRMDNTFLKTILDITTTLNDTKAVSIITNALLALPQKGETSSWSQIHIFNTALKAYLPGRQKKGKNAPELSHIISIKKRMEQNGVKPTAITYCIILSILFGTEVYWEEKAEVVELTRQIFAEVVARKDKGLIQNARIWGKVAEIYGKARLEADLRDHLRLWRASGPRFSRGSLTVIKSAFSLCNLPDDVEKTSNLIASRDAYYANKKKTGQSGVATPIPLAPGWIATTHNVDSVDALETPGEAVKEVCSLEERRPSIAVTGVTAKATEAEVLLLLRRCGVPVFLQVYHIPPDTMMRLHVRYAEESGNKALLKLSGMRFAKRKLLCFEDVKPVYGSMSEQQRGRLGMDLAGREAVLRGVHTAKLADSMFVVRTAKQKTAMLNRTVKRLLRR